ncbi:alpha/beta hydrolase [Deinococcus hohokamensis]|uniref:Alpha/beta hydrolase n=1 Tax=Deinococcus hohokamensis TaxID=309883 RepID=A0ABV9I6B6_9DEIO
MPREATPGSPPAVVLLHGVGANEISLLGLSPALDPRFTLISVRAPVEVHPGGYGLFRVTFTPEPVIVPQEAESSQQQLASFLPGEHRQESQGLDPRRLLLLGFSQGAMIGARMAVSRPERVAGLVMLSGRILSEVQASFRPAELSALPVFLAHGHHDDKLGIHRSRASQDLFTGLGVKLTSREDTMDHEIGAEVLTEVGLWLARQAGLSPGRAA